MKKMSLLFLILTIFTITGCDSIEDTITDDVIDPDGLITLEDVNQQNYNLKTPLYDIAVSIDDRVNLPQDEILMLIDTEIADFLNCQFFEGSDLGFDEFILDNQQVVSPLSELSIYVVPKNFECDAVDKSICAGIYFSSIDSLAVAEEGFGRCGDLPLLKHEIAHRYGMLGDHSNQDEFASCSDPENCGSLDFFDDINIGR